MHIRIPRKSNDFLLNQRTLANTLNDLILIQIDEMGNNMYKMALKNTRIFLIFKLYCFESNGKK